MADWGLGLQVGVGTCTVRYERTKVDAEKLMKGGRVDTGLWGNSSSCCGNRWPLDRVGVRNSGPLL